MRSPILKQLNPLRSCIIMSRPTIVKELDEKNETIRRSVSRTDFTVVRF